MALPERIIFEENIIYHYDGVDGQIE